MSSMCEPRFRYVVQTIHLIAYRVTKWRAVTYLGTFAAARREKQSQATKSEIKIERRVSFRTEHVRIWPIHRGFT